MIDLLDLYDLAEDHGTQVVWFDLEAAESLSMPLSDGSCAIYRHEPMADANGGRRNGQAGP